MRQKILEQFRACRSQFAKQKTEALYGFAHWLTVLSATTLTFLLPSIHSSTQGVGFLYATAVLHVASMAGGLVVVAEKYVTSHRLLQSTMDYYHLVAEATAADPMEEAPIPTPPIQGKRGGHSTRRRGGLYK